MKCLEGWSGIPVFFITMAAHRTGIVFPTMKIQLVRALLLRSYAFQRETPYCHPYCHRPCRIRLLLLQQQKQLRFASVTGPIYENDDDQQHDDDDDNSHRRLDITLFTKEGCTLCDTAKEVLQSVRVEYPHSLRAIDITDDDQTYYWDKYKYDIPVLHINDQYWTKHRITADQARAALQSYRETGTFVSPAGEPNAAALERRTQ
jgi:glutaredoxin